ncbi:thiopeptide-type bacteriocin biosynthesis protein [Streptacidiphilus sp. BW17]|uniref:lantibiotic dehydratase n=1 Tax=Streptacidiphilus sp. BW17 TaxID=3156274 RepID=UPI003511AA68
MYQYLGAALFRSTVFPSGLDLPARPASSGDPDADSAALRDWITAVWAHAAVREPVSAASPQLAARLEAVTNGTTLAPRLVRRAALALHRYVLRQQHRPTPFGLVAGITPATVGEHAHVVWGERHRVRARADANWVRAMADVLEAQPDVLAGLLVTADASVTVRGDRLVLPYRPADGPDAAPGEMSVRSIPLVRAALLQAEQPIPFPDLVAVLVAQHSGAEPEPVAALVRGLVTAGLLHTSAHPPMTATDPVRHLLVEAEKAPGDAPPATTATVAGLRAVHHLMLRHDRAPAGRKAALRAVAQAAMTELSPRSAQPLDVDLHLDAQVTLPHRIVREAERAADLLSRLTARPDGSRAWAEFHRRFLDRYGTGALVPLLRLVDPNLGLGWPAGYRGALTPSSTAGVSARDRQLLALAQRAAHEHRHEVELTEAQIVGLDQRRPNRRYHELPHLDMRLQLHAISRQAVDSGDFTISIDGVVPCAGAAAGRFLDLLDHRERNRFEAAVAAAATVVAGAAKVQISSPPLTVSTGSVTRVPALLPVLAVGESAPRGGLTVDMLGVGADAHHLYLVDLDSGSVVEPMLLSAVELVHRTHPLARFLAELPRARTAAFAPFDWGAADALPYLPRVRHGRAILAPARWRVTGEDLADGIAAWREHYQVPPAVEIGGADRRLRLDLDQPGEAELLHAALTRDPTVTVREAADPKVFGWCDGRAHALTLALGSTQSPRPRPALSRRPLGARSAQLPGQVGWSTLKLYGHPEHADTVLASHLPELGQPTWWFIRYRDPEPHLRLRFPISAPEDFGSLAERVAAWVDDLRALGLASRAVWDGYQPETGRYGERRAMSAAEGVFVADSAAALAQAAFQSASGTPAEAVTAASLLDLTAWLLGDASEAARWMVKAVNTAHTPHPARDVLTRAMALAAADPAYPSLRRLPGGAELAQVWTARGQALAAYRIALRETGGPTLAEAALSLLHMHHIRAIGPDEKSESLCLRLARSAALSWTAREGATR